MTGDEIRALRAKMGVSQARFGSEFPVDSRTIRRWEADQVDPSPMAVQRLQALVDALEETPKSSPATRRRALGDVVG